MIPFLLRLLAGQVLGKVVKWALFAFAGAAIMLAGCLGGGGLLVASGGYWRAPLLAPVSVGGAVPGPNGTVIVLPGMVSDAERYLLARAAGFDSPNALTATEVSIAEDPTGNPAIEHTNHDGSIDLGLWQINSGTNPIGVAWMEFGGHDALVVPQTNANAAYTMWRRRGFEPWTTFTSGAYLEPVVVARAQAAANLADAPALRYVFPLPGWTGAINLHWGVAPGGSDLFAPSGFPVVSISSGTVLEAGWDNVGGNAVLIKGSGGLEYYYAHFRDRPMVSARQQVVAGQQIGAVGNTGDAAGGPTHLHLGIGYSILLGADAYGGTGSGFDAVTFLRQLYASMHAGG